jgi:hypothetical protein
MPQWLRPLLRRTLLIVAVAMVVVAAYPARAKYGTTSPWLKLTPRERKLEASLKG